MLTLHRNAQRLLEAAAGGEPLCVRLTFPDSKTRTRRDHVKYLTLIRPSRCCTSISGHVKTVEHRRQAVRVHRGDLSDIELANKLTHEVLGRSLDEMPPQTRRLLLMVDAMVTAECKRQKIERSEYRFSRRDVRAATSWSDYAAEDALAPAGGPRISDRASRRARAELRLRAVPG